MPVALSSFPTRRSSDLSARQQSCNAAEVGAGIFPSLVQMAPHRRRPTGIAGLSPDDMQVQLRHHVADAGEVHLGKAEGRFEEFRNQRRLCYRESSLRIRQIELMLGVRF